MASAPIERLWLRQLRADDFRNLASVELGFTPGANVLFGPNGSGKTSVLEAIYMLATARSFRSGRPGSVVRFEQPETRLFGEFVIGGRAHRIGMSRSRSGVFQARINGQPAQQASELAADIPVVLITPETLDLVSGTPESRRRCLDWGVFHVEPSVKPAWSRFRRALLQRNTLLRRDAPVELIRPWDQELSHSGAQLTEARRRYLALLLGTDTVVRALDHAGATIDLISGWSSELELAEVLASNEQRDRQMGHTTAGPHRADLRIRAEGRSASDVMSRGQRKRLSIELRLGQLEVLADHTEKPAIVLADDLGSELDESATQGILGRLADMGVQRFLTTLGDPGRFRDRDDDAMFHVEHGVVTGPPR